MGRALGGPSAMAVRGHCVDGIDRAGAGVGLGCPCALDSGVFGSYW
jgi:hypothetical protein